MMVTSIGYFYVHKDQDLAIMLKTMAYQIQASNSAYREHVVQALGQTGLYTAKQIWRKLFLDFWNDKSSLHSRVILVIDGLDMASAEEIDNFAHEMVRSITKKPDHNIQLAIFGLGKLWADFDFIVQGGHIKIEDHNRTDLSVYVDRELGKVKVLRKAREEERTQYRKKILDCADGVCEWARLFLAKCKNQEKGRILKMLDNPPRGLDDMIEVCLDQVFEDEDIEAETLRSVLTWLTYSKRFLRFGELYKIVCIETAEEHELLWDTIVSKLSSLVRWTSPRARRDDLYLDDGSLEVLDEATGWSKELSKTLVMFSNTRIKEYVIYVSALEPRSVVHGDRLPPFPKIADCMIVKTCLKIMQDQQVRHLGFEFLAAYPARFMVRHLQAVDLQAVSKEDKAEILTGLIWLFHNEDGHQFLAIDAVKSNAGDNLVR